MPTVGRHRLWLDRSRLRGRFFSAPLPSQAQHGTCAKTLEVLCNVNVDVDNDIQISSGSHSPSSQRNHHERMPATMASSCLSFAVTQGPLCRCVRMVAFSRCSKQEQLKVGRSRLTSHTGTRSDRDQQPAQQHAKMSCTRSTLVMPRKMIGMRLRGFTTQSEHLPFR